METTTLTKSFKLEKLLICVLALPVIHILFGFIPRYGTAGIIIWSLLCLSLTAVNLTLFCIIAKTEMKRTAKIGAILCICACGIDVLAVLGYGLWFSMQDIWMDLFYFEEYKFWKVYGIFSGVMNALIYLLYIPGTILFAIGANINKGMKLILILASALGLTGYIYNIVQNAFIYDLFENVYLYFTIKNIMSLLIRAGLLVAAIFTSGITRKKALPQQTDSIPQQTDSTPPVR